MPSKEFLSIPDQIALLRSRGLTIENEAQAYHFLLHHNYYRISGYTLTLRKHDIFSTHSTFQNVIDIYSFDYVLRHILLKYIEQIEVSIKSIYAYEFAKRYGPLGYLNSEHFLDLLEYHRIRKSAEELQEKNKNREPYLKHFLIDLQQKVPLWVFVEQLTIADISKLYKITAHEIQTAAASAFGFTTTKGYLLLSSHLHGMTILRNFCAHGHRLYNRFFITKPKLNAQDMRLLPKNKDGNPDNTHLYSYLLTMRQLLVEDDFSELKGELCELSRKYPFVSMRHYGFPGNISDTL